MKITLLALLISTLALPAIASSSCEVPSSLEGKTFINKTSPDYSPQNPNADSMLKLDFSKESYTSHFLKTGLKVEGSYRYERLSQQVGVMNAKESFGGQTTEFSLTMVCLNDVSGTFVFNQISGAIKPDVRQNTGTYTIQ